MRIKRLRQLNVDIFFPLQLIDGFKGQMICLHSLIISSFLSVSFSERPSHSSVICHWSLCNCIVGFYIPLRISVRGRSRLVSAGPGPWYVINPGLTLMCVSAERNRLHTDRSLFLWMTDGRGWRRQLRFSSH